VLRSPASVDVGDATVAGLRAAAALHEAEDVARLEAAATLADGDSEEAERRVLIAAREHLMMDVAYCTRFTEAAVVVRRVDGYGRSLGLRPGTTFAREMTFCQRVIDGRLANLVADAQHDTRLAELVPPLRSYVGVPVRLSDGRLYGSLCCASRAAAPWLRERDVTFLRLLARMLAHALERGELERIAQRNRNEVIALGALCIGLDARDGYTSRHSQAVVDLAERVTHVLAMPEIFVEEVRQVALLHDIGKIGIPDAILAKQAPLDDEQWETMRTHPVIGADMAASIPALAHLAPAIRAEHERWDGTGYPDGLIADQIPLASRITFACDAYDAMTSARPYRPAPMHPSAAAAHLRADAGAQFDPVVISALLSLLQR
jgi:HD domain-containing protein/GAF domain-containing protein